MAAAELVPGDYDFAAKGAGCKPALRIRHSGCRRTPAGGGADDVQRRDTSQRGDAVDEGKMDSGFRRNGGIEMDSRLHG